jgi:hypothetical protein
MADRPLPPIECQVAVPWRPDDAYRRFVHEFAAWWPRRTHSIGGARVREVVFEARAGGRIFEQHVDGRRFQWGRVLEISAPERVLFSFHPSRAESTAQTVEVRFLAEGSGTRVMLKAWNWEKWGRGAAAARRGYRIGWGYVLRHWAGRRTAGMLLVDSLGGAARIVHWLRGGTAGAIRRAGGEIERAPLP